MSASSSTVVAVLTPPGAAAIATLALVGPRAWSVARELFRPAAGASPLPDPPPPDRYWYGQIGGPPGDAVVLSVRRLAPVSWVEIHCHGGPAVVHWLTRTLCERGMTVCDWSDALARAGSPPLRTLAAAELTRAATRRAAGILLDQWHGAFDRALAELDALLTAGDRTTAAGRLAALSQLAPLGRHLTRPWRVVLAGAPNVGKSSLVNALAGYQRSVVTPIPGTTRDAVSTALAVDGWPVELIDTAGLHDSGDDLEGQGIARAQSAAGAADLVLWVVDATGPAVWPDCDHGMSLRVINKIDQPAAWDVAAVPDAVRVSAVTGAGLGTLCARISARLAPDPPAPGATVPFTPALADGVEAAARLLAEGQIDSARGTLRRLSVEPLQADPAR
jgi:tRNA modification GTPase